MRVLGAYSLSTAVGVGSTGTVWRAVQADLGRTVAVKVLAPGASQDLLRAEARVLASLDHPNIVKVYDFAEAGAQSPQDPAWLAEEWVDGERLDELVARLDSPLTAEQGLGVIRGALLGLAHAHEHGVVHGDVSAGNVLIDTAGTSKLIDFGLASPVGSTSTSGTPTFMSPEAAQALPVTPASDVYSAAALLFFLLAGAPPFASSAADSLLEQHVSQPPPRLQDHGDRLADVLERAMAKDPHARPQDAAAFLAELEDAAEDRYGAGWLARASVAGLAAAPAMAMAMAVETTLGASAAPVGPAAVTALVSGASDDSDRAGRPRSWKPVAAAAAGVVVAGVVIAVVATGGKAKKPSVTAAPPVSAAPVASVAPATPTPTVAPPVRLSATLAGRYRVSTVVTASEIASEPAGHRFSDVVWTIKACSALPCQVAISSSSGRHYVAAFDGTYLTFPFTDSARNTCLDNTTNQPVPGVTALTTNKLTFRLAVSGLETGTPSLAGSSAAVQSYSDPIGDCALDKPQHETRRVVGTRL